MFQKIICFVAFTGLFSFNVQANDIKLVIQYQAGGSADRIARIIEQSIKDPQYRVQTEYRIGNNGGVAHNFVAEQQKPNQTVILVASNSFVSLPVLSPDTVKYNINKDFQIVNYVGSAPLMLTVSANGPIKNWQDFVQHSKKNQMFYGSVGHGSSGHVAGALIGHAIAPENFTNVPYKGPAIVDLVSNNINFVVEAVGLVDPMIKDKKLRPIAAWAPSRVPEYQSVPTLRELGVNDYNQYRWFVLIANRSANPQTIEYLRRVLSSASVQKELKDFGLDTRSLYNDNSQFLNEELKKITTVVDILKLK